MLLPKILQNLSWNRAPMVALAQKRTFRFAETDTFSIELWW